MPRCGRCGAGSRRRGPSAAALLAWALTAAGAPNALSADAGAPSQEATPSLQPLPELRETPLPQAEAEELSKLDRLVDQLLAKEATERFEARRRVSEVDASWLPAIAERFGR